MQKDSKIYIAGQEGMVGQAIYKLLKKEKYNIIDCKRNELDLTNQNTVKKWLPSFALNSIVAKDPFLYQDRISAGDVGSYLPSAPSKSFTSLIV